MQPAARPLCAKVLNAVSVHARGCGCSTPASHHRQKKAGLTGDLAPQVNGLAESPLVILPLVRIVTRGPIVVSAQCARGKERLDSFSCWRFLRMGVGMGTSQSFRAILELLLTCQALQQVVRCRPEKRHRKVLGAAVMNGDSRGTAGVNMFEWVLPRAPSCYLH